MPDRPPRGVTSAVGLALLLTLVLGGWMRWALAGRLPLALDFADLRHAHSHLGYYGLLFPLAWLAWRRVGAPVPGPRLVVLYGAATAVAFVGFLQAGYGPVAIAGSAVVGLVWLVTAWRLRHRLGDLDDPLALILPGVVLAEACIPPIAATVDAQPVVAQRWVATFLAVLLLAVVVPSALASRGGRAGSWPLVGAMAALGSAALGVWPSWPARLGLLAYGAWLLWSAWGSEAPAHLKGAWGAVAAGLAAMAAGVLPNNRPVVVGAIHFLVLSPVLVGLANLWVPRAVPTVAWWVYHGLVTLLAAPLVAQGIGWAAGTMTLSAVGGTGVLAWWVWAVARPLWTPPDSGPAPPRRGNPAEGSHRPSRT